MREEKSAWALAAMMSVIAAGCVGEVAGGQERSSTDGPRQREPVHIAVLSAGHAVPAQLTYVGPSDNVAAFESAVIAETATEESVESAVAWLAVLGRSGDTRYYPLQLDVGPGADLGALTIAAIAPAAEGLGFENQRGQEAPRQKARSGGGGVIVSVAGDYCNPDGNTCACVGLWDCIDMIVSGVCQPGSLDCDTQGDFGCFCDPARVGPGGPVAIRAR